MPNSKTTEKRKEKKPSCFKTRQKRINHVGIWRRCHLKQLSASFNHVDLETIKSLENISECSQYALERLDLYGTIPEKPFGRLTNLRGLDLSYNRFNRFNPRLRFLEVLDLSNNQVSGPISTFLGKLSQIDLSSNLLNGTIPVSVGKLSKLPSLHLSNNSLERVVSEAHFANLSMLKHLDTCSNTKLTFNVSHEWIPPFLLLLAILQMHVVQYYNLGYSMPIIPFLDLYHNKLNGPMKNLPYGYVFGGVLFVENKLFNESIPRSLCKSTYLALLHKSVVNWENAQVSCETAKWLKLNDNNFIELGNLRDLRVFDVGDNKLSRMDWIGLGKNLHLW
uniref:Leucine-rich repeat-containing N-terminal plant-type domain-containing protein n=1 Tax=Lactuca sativa TaxID=4236 RepID=A0A9R1WXG4_LACSA|nr:hypothetical protein LSAT_V11C800419660 [Lactuca sativa]